MIRVPRLRIGEMTVGARHAVRALWLAVIVLAFVNSLFLYRWTNEGDRIRAHVDKRVEQIRAQSAAANRAILRDFCAYLRPQASVKNPPTTDRGRDVQDAAARLMNELHCPMPRASR